MQEEDLRARMKRRLRSRFTENLWSYLEEQGFVEDAIGLGADRGLELLEVEARRILEAAEPSEPRKVEVSRPGGPTPGQERAWALSQLAAARADDDPDVVSFRSKHLDGQLVEWAEVESWIQAQSERDGSGTVDITCALPFNQINLDRKGGWRVDPPLIEFHGQVSTRTLSYAVSQDTWVRRISVTADGVLDKLRVLADSLARAYAWTPGQATTFVLTGLTPQVSTIRVTGLGFKIRNGVSHAWARRIVLTIDPAASPQQVLRAYQDARRKEGLDRLRPLDPKKARLAAFTGAEHVGKTWSERWRLWNQKFPEWKYSQQSNFRRDAMNAQYRLLYPGGSGRL